MPSPFPGMDPYIEASGIWGDFHLSFLASIRAALNARLPARYVASGERHVWLHEPAAHKRVPIREPDVFVKDRKERASGSLRSATLLAPTTVILPAVRRYGNRYLRIVDVANQRVVTVIEVLSPFNKSSTEERNAYCQKRKDYLAAGVNLVEIDLLRKGKRMPMGKPAPERADYYVLICRSSEMPKAGVWPIRIRDPLPEIPIPLDPEVRDVFLPLRGCLDRVYDEGRYRAELNYQKSLKPPLHASDDAWVRRLLASHLHKKINSL